jgi:hypothetical protein
MGNITSQITRDRYTNMSVTAQLSGSPGANRAPARRLLTKKSSAGLAFLPRSAARGKTMQREIF